jgi:hypothetical protein
MNYKKVCILGARAVGKSSLVKRFLSGSFSDRYSATVGANIEKIVLDIDTDRVQLMLWDIQGEDQAGQTFTHYLKGASAIIYVVDGTRLDTLEAAMELRKAAETHLGSKLPSIMLFNKSDLAKDWEISSSMINDVESDGIFALLTSAREGSGVNTAFSLITRVILGKTSMIAA